MPEDSGKSSAMLAAIVEGLPELIRLKVTSPETERMIATAIVSPSARPRPSIEPPTIADLPKGRTAILMTSQRVAPRASAPSIWARGVRAKTSRVIALMIGRIMRASTNPTTSIVRPVAEAGPSKSGIQPRWSASHCWKSTDAGPSTAMPQSPKTMLGIAASRSTM